MHTAAALSDGNAAAAQSSGHASEAADSSEESSDYDEHAYQSDSDIDDNDSGAGGGMARMLQLLEQDKDVPPEQLIVAGKRQRTAVDYRQLNDEMFGAGESYEGEGSDADFKQRSRRKASD